eukprot:4980157-Prymnesium_polylepis.1
MSSVRSIDPSSATLICAATTSPDGVVDGGGALRGAAAVRRVHPRHLHPALPPAHTASLWQD